MKVLSYIIYTYIYVDKERIHLPRVELFLQEIARREPLYFQQRAIEEQDDAYAGDDYRKHYYKV